MPDDHAALLSLAYAAFNARDIEAALSVMHARVDWPNVMDDRRVHGHAEVGDYWRRQFAEIDPEVQPRRFRRLEDGRVAVDVQQTVRALDGSLVSDSSVVHVYTICDGLIGRMDVEGTGA